MIFGVDLSSYLEEKAHGAKWFIKGEETTPFKAFKQNGASLVRLRVWNHPYDEEGNPYQGGTCDVNYLIESSKIAKEEGLDVLVDFHYSDFWADPGKQTLPKAWKDYSFEEVEQAIYDFTKETLTKLKELDIPVTSVQVGNEITNGMCWPYGRILGEMESRVGFDNLAILLKAGVKAVREVYPDAKVILHLENAGNLFIINQWYQEITSYGVDFDIIGLSYYPYWHGSIPNFFYNVGVLQSKYHKDVWVTEIAYAFTDTDYLAGKKGQLVVEGSNLDKLPDEVPYPLSKEGQVAFFKQFINEAKLASVKAIIYWEPAYIPVNGCGWATNNAQKYIGVTTFKDPRNEWANQNLFDYGGEATPAFYIFKD